MNSRVKFDTRTSALNTRHLTNTVLSTCFHWRSHGGPGPPFGSGRVEIHPNPSSS